MKKIILFIILLISIVFSDYYSSEKMKTLKKVPIKITEFEVILKSVNDYPTLVSIDEFMENYAKKLNLEQKDFKVKVKNSRYAHKYLLIYTYENQKIEFPIYSDNNDNLYSILFMIDFSEKNFFNETLESIKLKNRNFSK